ncbi:MAG: ERCC4 domain-containing protein [Lentisphaeria bacterium]|nr:ERCC4 domain-containing protein [Lentisphaeria bacterium]
MVIVIDTREQRPWSFPPHIETEIGTLRTGDYALKGDDRFAIERKSADDFVGTISSGWGRFVRELNRMDEACFAAKTVIVEADFESFCFRTESGRILPPDHEHTRLTPQFVMKRIAQLTLRNVSVIFAGNADLASAIALSLFFERQNQLAAEKLTTEKLTTEN